MPPDIRFDQGDTGTVNRSRSDITKSSLDVVALNVVGTAVFGLLDRPFGSAAALTGVAALNRQLVPDVAGTYRLRVIDDDDGSSVTHTVTVLSTLDAVVSQSLDLHMAAHNERADPTANEVDVDPGTWVNGSETNEGGSFKGWDPADQDNFRKLAAIVRPFGWIRGLEISLNGVTPASEVDIAVGSCISDDEKRLIHSSAILTADITASGADGLDTGTEAADTWYSVWVIEGGGNPTASLLSVSSTAPTLPGTYTSARRVGWVRNDATSNFRPFTSHGVGIERQILFTADRDDLAVFVNQEPTTYTVADCSEFVPPTSQLAHFDMSLQTPDSDYVEFRLPGSGIANGQGRRMWGQGGKDLSESLVMDLSPTQTIEYRRNGIGSNGASMYIPGYWECL